MDLQKDEDVLMTYRKFAYDPRLCKANELLDILARKLGYDYVLLVEEKSSAELVCVFGTFESYSYCAAKTFDGKHVALRKCDALSSSAMYERLLRKLHEILDNGDAVYAEDKKLDASMVPEFMMECVLAGLA